MLEESASMKSIETWLAESRRKFFASIAGTGAGLAVAQRSRAQEPAFGTANGGAQPYPIPWLDKNGSHNQPAGPNLEPSHIYHFKGQVARCSTFTGVGTDNKGNRI